MLYLASSEAGVIAELPVGDDKSLWIQRFRGPHQQLADARSLDPQSLAAAVFLMIERQRDPGEHAALGPHVARIVNESFAGLIVPGLRDFSTSYCNVVLFAAGETWLNLLDTASAPWRAA